MSEPYHLCPVCRDTEWLPIAWCDGTQTGGTESPMHIDCMRDGVKTLIPGQWCGYFKPHPGHTFVPGRCGCWEARAAERRETMPAAEPKRGRR